MTGSIPKEMWDEVVRAFVVLPEGGWKKSMIAAMQQKGWNLKKANEFIAWVEIPKTMSHVSDKLYLEYMTDKMTEFEAALNPQTQKPMEIPPWIVAASVEATKEIGVSMPLPFPLYGDIQVSIAKKFAAAYAQQVAKTAKTPNDKKVETSCLVCHCQCKTFFSISLGPCSGFAKVCENCRAMYYHTAPDEVR